MYCLIILTCPCRMCCLLFSKSYRTPTCAHAYIISFLELSVRFKTGIFLLSPNDQMTFWNKKTPLYIYTCMYMEKSAANTKNLLDLFNIFLNRYIYI